MRTPVGPLARAYPKITRSSYSKVGLKLRREVELQKHLMLLSTGVRPFLKAVLKG